MDSQPAVTEITDMVKQSGPYKQKKETRKGRGPTFKLRIREDGSSIQPLNSNPAVSILGRAPNIKIGVKCQLPTC